jgi:hypothetical protein
MRPEVVLKYEFVEFIPEQLKERTVYVCIPFATVVHKCCCGCGSEVVTPLTPTDWKLIFDGVSISLYPSIGNWSFRCQSHYWIQHNRVRWAGRWSQQEIEAGRAADMLAKADYFGNDASKTEPPAPTPEVVIKPDVPANTSKPDPKALRPTWWRRLLGRLFGE